jgi:hypothetical protein
LIGSAIRKKLARRAGNTRTYNNLYSFLLTLV